MDAPDELFLLCRLTRLRIEKSLMLMRTAQAQTQGLDLEVSRQREQLQAQAQCELMARQRLQLTELEHHLKAEYGLFVPSDSSRGTSKVEVQLSDVARGRDDAE